MESVLIVSGGEKGCQLLESLLRQCSFAVTAVARSGCDARRLLLETGFDLVVINAPLGDEFGDELAVLAAEQELGAGVILIVKAEIADSVAARVEEDGVFVMEKPLSRPLFFQAVKLLEAAYRRMAGLRRRNGKLQNQIEEMRLVDRAKCALIQYLNMTEAQAHRYVEKQAMDLRKSKTEVAEGILRTYETYER